MFRATWVSWRFWVGGQPEWQPLAIYQHHNLLNSYTILHLCAWSYLTFTSLLGIGIIIIFILLMGKLRQRQVRIQLGTSDSRVSVYSPRSWWMKRHNLCLKQQSQIMNASPHPECVELFGVLWLFGPSLKLEECVPSTKGLKKKRRKERKPSPPGISFHRTRKAFMTCCDSEAGSWHSLAVN